MIKPFTFLLFITIFLSSCELGNGREYDIIFPADLVVHNRSKNALNLNAIYSTPEAKDFFSTTPTRIASQGTYSSDMTEPMHKTIAARQFIVDGYCDDSTKWSIHGKEVTLIDDGVWLLAIEIDCEDILKSPMVKLSD